MRKMINNIASVLEGVTTAAIAGHVRPDGDCVGSCMGMYLYLKENYPQIQTDVYLEEVPEVFHFIQTSIRRNRNGKRKNMTCSWNSMSAAQTGSALPVRQ